MNDEKEIKHCDECGKEITNEYYYIGDNNAAMTTPTDTFCSEVLNGGHRLFGQ